MSAAVRLHSGKRRESLPVAKRHRPTKLGLRGWLWPGSEEENGDTDNGWKDVTKRGQRHWNSTGDGVSHMLSCRRPSSVMGQSRGRAPRTENGSGGPVTGAQRWQKWHEGASCMETGAGHTELWK